MNIKKYNYITSNVEHFGKMYLRDIGKESISSIFFVSPTLLSLFYMTSSR